ncbi:MAG: P1 family peptidase [Ardenticatenaceae bacterium]|nr:P1 family peptidase [Ardenticatenaceae bacterium]
MPRIQELEIYHNRLPRGPLNAITDVPGVAVGHETLITGNGTWQPGRGPFRTGVTVVLPHQDNLYAEKVPAAVHTINGFGKVTGFEQVRELGRLETPIALTGTLNVPRVADALISLAIEQNPHIGVGFAETGRKGYASVNPVVGETSDGFLSDIQARPIGENEVRTAVSQATTGPVSEGVVGAGTGTSCFGWKGGIGTASRVLPVQNGSFTIGALVQSNYGSPEELTIAGVPVGQHIQPPQQAKRAEDGSIMIVLATNAPLNGRQLGRLCRRAAFGLARTGSTCHGGSGDFVIAFSTAYRLPDQPKTLVVERPFLDEQPIMSSLALAVIEAVEEAIYNSLFMAHTVVGRDGNTRYALPVDEVVAVMRQYGR